MRGLVALVSLGLLAAACGSSSTPTSSTSSTPSTGVNVVVELVKTVNGQQVPVLARDDGQTLYYLTSDTATTVACSGQCVAFWPPLLLASGTPSSGMTLPGKLAVITDPNGAQVTYAGHPLYAFVKDKTANDVKGEGIKAFGGVWHAATLDVASQ